MKPLYIFIIAFLIPLFLPAQKVKIVQVVEPTLFVLNTSEWVRLANIQSPDSVFKDPALNAMHSRKRGLILKNGRINVSLSKKINTRFLFALYKLIGYPV